MTITNLYEYIYFFHKKFRGNTMVLPEEEHGRVPTPYIYCCKIKGYLHFYTLYIPSLFNL